MKKLSQSCLDHIKYTNDVFQYKTDDDLYDSEEVWANGLDEDGFGDCEDYSLEIRKHCGGDIYYCMIGKSGHAVLQLPNGQWIDNVYRKPIDKQFDKRYTGFKKYWKITIWLKLFFGWFKKNGIKLPG